MGVTAGKESGPAALTRVTVNLTQRSSAALDLLTGLTGDSKTDTVNRALQIYAYLEHVVHGGGSIHVRKADGSELEQVKIL
jgi:hypothetical protein